MASIDASTSGAGGIITTADNTGTLNIQSGGTTIATISSTGLAVASGKTLSVNGTTVPSNIPAFSAYANSATSLSNSAFTKISFQVEEYDTNSNYASSRFTPTVAGYYQINAASNVAGGTTAETSISIYKNGSGHKQGLDLTISSGAQYSQTISSLVYCNGSTDYIEIYLYVGTSGKSTGTGEVSVWFNGAMIRSA